MLMSLMSTNAALLEKIRARNAKVGVIGLGYVGLPLAVEFARAGLDVTGFDVDDSKIQPDQRREELHPRRAGGRSRRRDPGRPPAGDDGHASAGRDGRHRHLRPDAAPKNQRSRSVLHRESGGGGRRDAAARPVGDPRVDDLSGDDRGGRAADARSQRAESGRRFLPGVFPRARRSRQRAVHDAVDPEGRRRRRTRRAPKRRRSCTARSCRRLSPSARRASPRWSSCSRTRSAR